MGTPKSGCGDELAELRAALVAAVGGAGRLVLAAGETGIGRTGLALAAQQMAAEYDVPAAAGRALDDPGMPPLWPWHEAARSVPQLRVALAGAIGGLDSESERFRLFATACEALGAAAAERGMLLILEDFQWADLASLLLLRRLAGELAGLRLLVVATFRDDPGAGLTRMLPELLRSGGPGWVARCVRWAREAARSATVALAYGDAVRFAELALRAAEADETRATAGPRAELTRDLAQAQFTAGNVAACLASCQAAARLAEEGGRPDILASAALVITGMGDPAVTAAVELLRERALCSLPDGEAVLRARLRARQAMFAVETGACERARELSAEALALAEGNGDADALLDALHARHLSLCAPQFLAQRLEIAARACQAARQARQPLAELWGHVWLVDAAFQAGDLGAVDSELGQIEQFATYHGQPLAWWHLHRLRATRAALTGELDAAVTHNETARAVAATIGASSTTGMYHAFLGQLAVLRGTIDPEGARATLAALRQYPTIPLVRIFIPLTYALSGDTELARATFEEFRHLPGALEVGPRWAGLMHLIGVLAIRLGDTEVAERLYQEVEGLPPAYSGDGSGLVFSHGSMQRMIGDLALATGRVDEAIARQRHAIEMNARIGARPFLALSRLGLAKALLARALREKAHPGDLPDARDLVTRAAAEFRRLDLPGRLDEADAVLAAIDAAARAANPLSPRESEVAALIAQAMSNRQIAGKLVLSERTVETHVRSVLAKLGYSTRTEIAAWFTGHAGKIPATRRP
jgi:DNA-binding CsgD family transcriptional regulator